MKNITKIKIKKILVFLLIAAVFLPCGCYSLRKKFVRKKKYTKELPVYVDFKEYSRAPSKESYVSYYLFVRGWIDELITTVDKGVSFKRQKRAAEEIIMNLEQMMSFYNQAGKDEVYPLYEKFLAVKQEMEKNPYPSEVRRISFLKNLEHLKRVFESTCNYTDAGKWIGGGGT